MLWWWIGNAVFIIVVIPVVLLLLQRLLRPAVEIEKSADEVAAHVRRVAEGLDATSALLQTRDRVSRVSNDFGRYVNAVDRLL